MFQFPTVDPIPLPAPVWFSNCCTSSLKTEPVKKGEQMFRGQCGACHTETGCRAMKDLLGRRDEKSIANIVRTLLESSADSPYRKYMPTLTAPAHETALQQPKLPAKINPQ